MDLVNRVRYFATSRQRFRRNASAAVDEVATNFVALVQQLDQWNEGLLADLSRAVKVTEEPSMLANRILQTVEAVLREKRPYAAVFARCYSVSVNAARLELSLLSKLSEDYPWGKAATLLDTVIALGILAKLAPTVIDLLGFNDTDSKDGLPPKLRSRPWNELSSDFQVLWQTLCLRRNPCLFPPRRFWLSFNELVRLNCGTSRKGSHAAS